MASQPQSDDGFPQLPAEQIVQPDLLKNRRKEKRPWLIIIGLTAVISAVVILPVWFGIGFFSYKVDEHRRQNESVRHNNLAKYHYEHGDLDSAIAQLTKAIERDPSSAMAFANRAVVRYMRGDEEGAMADCNRAIELDPSLAEALVQRADIKANRGDRDGALADYAMAIQRDPAHALAYGNRATVRFDRGELDEAIADCNKALQLDSAMAMPYLTRAMSREAKGDLEGASADYTSAIDHHVDDDRVFKLRGLVRLRQGKEADAQQDFERYLTLRPEAKEELDQEIRKARAETNKKP